MEMNDYVLSPATKSRCSNCESYLHMLAPFNMTKKLPKFWICFICKTIYRIGKGRISSAENWPNSELGMAEDVSVIKP